VRIGELSRRSGVPVATIKYYLREGLLAPGQLTAPNQASYDEHHVRRLELIRALRDGADLSIATLARVLTVMDAREPHARPEYLTIAVAALSDPIEIAEEDAAAHRSAAADVDTLLDALGWDTDPGSPGRADLERALVAVRRYLPGLVDDPMRLRPFAEAVRGLADIEIPDGYDPSGEAEEALRLAVLGTVLFEPIITSLRKLAHVDRVRRLAARHEGT
jgi:DNA-binding transcriptional MerR regulator